MTGSDHSRRCEQLEAALLALDRAATLAVLEAASDEAGLSGAELADAVIVPALTHIGDEWEQGGVALSQVYMSARILEDVLDESFPTIDAASAPTTIGIGVLEDYHALGKRIIRAVLTSAGRHVVDLGHGLSAEEMVRRAQEASVDVLMISVLMFNKALHVAQVVELLEERGLGHVPVVVGGAPFRHDPTLWERVGADACGRSAADALRLATPSGAGGAA